MQGTNLRFSILGCLAADLPELSGENHILYQYIDRELGFGVFGLFLNSLSEIRAGMVTRFRIGLSILQMIGRGKQEAGQGRLPIIPIMPMKLPDLPSIRYDVLSLWRPCLISVLFYSYPFLSAAVLFYVP